MHISQDIISMSVKRLQIYKRQRHILKTLFKSTNNQQQRDGQNQFLSHNSDAGNKFPNTNLERKKERKSRFFLSPMETRDLKIILLVSLFGIRKLNPEQLGCMMTQDQLFIVLSTLSRKNQDRNPRRKNKYGEESL